MNGREMNEKIDFEIKIPIEIGECDLDKIDSKINEFSNIVIEITDNKYFMLRLMEYKEKVNILLDIEMNNQSKIKWLVGKQMQKLIKIFNYGEVKTN